MGTVRTRRPRSRERGRLVRSFLLVRSSCPVRLVKFNQIGLAGEPERIRHEHHARDIAFVAAFQVLRLVDSLVRIGAFGGVLIVAPDPLNQMHRRPPLAKEEVVEITKRNQVVVGELRHTILPKGRPSAPALTDEPFVATTCDDRLEPKTICCQTLLTSTIGATSWSSCEGSS